MAKDTRNMCGSVDDAVEAKVNSIIKAEGISKVKFVGKAVEEYVKGYNDKTKEKIKPTAVAPVLTQQPSGETYRRLEDLESMLLRAKSKVASDLDECIGKARAVRAKL